MSRKFYIHSFNGDFTAVERVGALGARAVGPTRNSQVEAQADADFLTANPAVARVKRA